MKPTEAQRLSLRSSLVAAIGEPDATVLMEAMPPIDYDNLATKDDLARAFGALDAKNDGLRSDMEGRFAMVDARFAQVDARFDQVDARFDQIDARFDQIDARFVAITAQFGGEIAAVRGEIAEVRGEMATLGGNLRSEIAGLRTEMASHTRNLVATQVASMLGVAGLILGFG